MTNAKSRLVRIIALALAVLMIVPMALVGCNKNTGVDQAALDAALKEALDAAQKAQDAADKAAQDAKDAQDKLDAAEKEAEDLQAQIDAMKNTTTAVPTTTTQAPVSEDAKVVDAYISTMLNSEKSDFGKLEADYKAVFSIYLGYVADEGDNPVVDEFSADAKAIAETIATAKIAIQRAPTVDYVNHLVAQLAADLDAIPTISERVKEAYDAIDFTSDEDIIDVVYANALVEEATDLLDIDVNADYTEIVAAQAEAIEAYGEEKLDLVTLIGEEYYRYTGAGDYETDAEVLYEDIYNAPAKEAIAEAIREVYGVGSEYDELDVAGIVFGKTIDDSTLNEDYIESIVDLYDDFYDEYKKEYAALQEAFEIAFVGEEYILAVDGNYLRNALAVAEARIAELEAAKTEFDKGFGKGTKGLKAIVDAYLGDADFIFAKMGEKIVNVNTELVAWMDKYNFDAKDTENLTAMMGDEKYYKTFIQINALLSVVNAWDAKLAEISEAAIEDALNSIEDDGAYLDYAETGAAVKALYVWYNGTFDKDGNSKGDGFTAAAKLLAKNNPASKIYEGIVDISIDTANLNYMLKENLGITSTDQIDDLSAALEEFEGVKLSGKKDDDTPAILAAIKATVKKIEKLDLDALTVEELADVAEYKAEILGHAEQLLGAIDPDDPGDNPNYDEDAEFKYATDSKNYDVVPFDLLADLIAAEEALLKDVMALATKIVEAYIGWTGEYNEDAEGFAIAERAGKFFDVDKFEISAYSYALISEIAAAFNGIDFVEIDKDVEIEAIDLEDPIAFSMDEVGTFYRKINDAFYWNIMNEIHKVACDELRNSTIVNGSIASNNGWMSYGYTAPTQSSTGDNKTLYDYQQTYAEFGLKFVYPTGSWNVGKGAGDINVYKTTGIADSNYSYVKAILAVDPLKYATKNADNTAVIAFDVAAYKAAVDASIASYRATWYSKYLQKSDNASTIGDLYENVMKNAVTYGLWAIKGEFEMNDETYTFVVNTDMSSVTVYDKLEDKVDLVENVDEEKYKLSAEFDEDEKKFVIMAAKLETPAVEDDEATTDIDESADAVYAAAVKLAEVDDDIATDAPKYEYVLADGIAEIAANCKTIGSVKKIDNSGTYVLYQEAWLKALDDAFVTNSFYKYRDSIVRDTTNEDTLATTAAYAAKNTAKASADDIGDTMLDNLWAEFNGTWKSVKHTNTTKDDIAKAYAKYVKAIAQIVAEHGVEA